MTLRTKALRNQHETIQFCTYITNLNVGMRFKPLLTAKKGSLMWASTQRLCVFFKLVMFQTEMCYYSVKALEAADT